MTWRRAARRTIQDIITDCRAKEFTPLQIKKAIDKGYPFGRRQDYPYTVWLEERKIALYQLGLLKPISLDGNKKKSKPVPPGQQELFSES